MNGGRKVGERGQVTVPKDIRERLGIGPGSEVEFSVEDGDIVMDTSKDSFVDWLDEVREEVGELEKTVDEYRDEEVRSRVVG
ncbi:MAG: AbrB/MazE/SpoVT family DNA-binding domain-containing protein [Candidatus Nanohaloarchaea archaeon]|nr:AbrB/MazE/SpoVT family DNA-binding domain-containing protein [Candidatus Nanohaloarchaea archaeon]